MNRGQKLSATFQVVIPREIRQRLHLRRGQKMTFLIKKEWITLVPERPLAELRGIARGIKPGLLREKGKGISGTEI
jgi:AbrB family looped-hinge helix DNA binding protein